MLGYNDYTTGGTVEEEVGRIHEKFKSKTQKDSQLSHPNQKIRSSINKYKDYEEYLNDISQQQRLKKNTYHPHPLDIKNSKRPASLVKIPEDYKQIVEHERSIISQAIAERES